MWFLQRSVLDLVLFLIYINDLLNTQWPEKYNLNADDTTITIISKPSSDEKIIINQYCGGPGFVIMLDSYSILTQDRWFHFYCVFWGLLRKILLGLGFSGFFLTRACSEMDTWTVCVEGFAIVLLSLLRSPVDNEQILRKVYFAFFHSRIVILNGNILRGLYEECSFCREELSVWVFLLPGKEVFKRKVCRMW